MKEQDKTLEKELNKMERSNWPDEEFKILVIKVLTKLRRRRDELGENVNKKIENIKKNQSALKNTIIEMKNTLKGTNSSLEDTVEQISDLKAKVVKITWSGQQKEKKRIKKMRIV